MVLRTRRKQTKKYYFSVEGETEKWYLEWLQKQINLNFSGLRTLKSVTPTLTLAF